jgi:outer membrane protein assembly factor BamB
VNEALRQTAQVTIEDGALMVKIADEAPAPMKPATALSFVAAGGGDLRIAFTGRGGMIEQMVLTRAGRTVNYRPIGEAEGRDAAPEGGADRIAAAALPPSPRTAARPWPAFRGANASGIADGQGAPVEWDVSTGKNILWKTAIPGFSNSAPIVWADRVIVTTSISSAGNDTFRIGLYGSTTPVDDLSDHVWRLYSLDRRTGKVLWERVVYEGPPKTKRHTKASQANSTPVTDGQRIVAVFGSIGLMVCYDMDGNLIWKKDLGVMHSGWFYDPDYTWGHSSSPIIYKDTVVVQVDTYIHSSIAAFKVDSGEEVWRTVREGEISTFGTPSIYSGPTGDEVVTNGTKMRSYDPATGRLLWQIGPNSEIPIPTPIVSGGLIFLTAGYPPLRPIYVVRPGHRGDLSLPKDQEKSDAIVWSANRGGVYIPTPIVYDGYFYTTAENGRLTCYKAETGEIMYQVRIGGVGGSYAASPIAADGKLYFASEEGDVFVVRAGPKYELLAKNSMNEIIMANPAVSNGVMVIRTLKHVYGVGGQ